MTFEARSGDWWIEGWAEAERTHQYQVRRGGAFVGWDGFASGLSHAADLRSALTQTLATSEHSSFFWECTSRPGEGEARFSFVLVDAPPLARLTANGAPFESHLAASDGLVATFSNLGGDALLVVPQAIGRPDAYAHLADFVRKAPPEQVDALWVAVGNALRQWRREERGRVWLSTSGLGVSWVHVRLDRRPKYYTHQPYRRAE